MSFRDDSDALLARNDALERECAELRERCERLEAELVEARKPPVKPPRPVSLLPSRATGALAGGVAILVLAGVVCVASLSRSSREPAAAPPLDAASAGSSWRDFTHRWHGLHALLHCRRNHANRLADPALGDTVHDPRGQDHNLGEWIHNLTTTGCENELAHAAGDRHLPPDAVAALMQWHQAELALGTISKELGLYYLHRDFVDDDLARARARWPELRTQVIAVEGALARVGRVAVQPIRDDVLATVAGRNDDAYWRSHLHVALDVLNETLYLDPPDPAQVADAAGRFRALSSQAPVDVRRLVRPAVEALGGDAASMRGPVFQALYDVTPGSYPSAEL